MRIRRQQSEAACARAATGGLAAFLTFLLCKSRFRCLLSFRYDVKNGRDTWKPAISRNSRAMLAQPAAALKRAPVTNCYQQACLPELLLVAVYLRQPLREPRIRRRRKIMF